MDRIEHLRMDTHQLLHIKNLSVSVTNGSEVVKSVGISIDKGEFVGILGESGSGKSVTCLSVGKLLAPSLKITGGQIEFNSEKFGPIDLLTTDDKTIRAIRGKEISYIFQEPMTALNPVRTCGSQLLENVLLEGKLNKNEAKAKCISLLKEVEIADCDRAFKSYPHQLSGGQRQRVMIAMALAQNPSLLIADEPTTALDNIVQHEVLELIRRISAKNNMAVAMVSHNLNVLQKFCTKLVVMQKGKVVETGTVDQILNHAQHPYTKALVKCSPAGAKDGYFLPTLGDFLSSEKEIAEELNKPLIPLPTLSLGKLILNISHLEKTYRITSLTGKTEKKQALRGVDLELMQGESVGIVGSSGCGKSTLARMVVKLESIDQGEITIQGESVSGIKNLPNLVQMVFQDPYSSLNPRKKIADILTVPMKVNNIGKSSKERLEMAAELLEKTGLSRNDLQKYPGQFSGGQRQRICIARALASKPKILICDEAVSALDVSVQAQVLNLLKQLQINLGLSLLFITHDMQAARYLCQRIMVIENGTEVETQTTKDLFAHPKSAYTQKLIALS